MSSIGLEGDGLVIEMGLVPGFLVIDVRINGFCDVCESSMRGKDLGIG